MSFSAPKPPDPTQVSNTQQQYNTQAAQQQNKNNSYNQSTAYGSVNYVPDASSPSGYRIESSLSPGQQVLLDTRTATQGIAGKTAQDLLTNTAGMYSQAPNIQALDPSKLVGQLNSWQQQYQQPIFNQQDSNLEAQLRSQGLTPGSEAYNNAKNLLARNQGDVTNQFLGQNIGTGLQAQQQKFGQDVTNYQLPLATAGTLFGTAAPAALNPNLQTPPQATMQPANYAGAAQNAYQGELSNYQNTWNNIGKLAGAGVSLAAAPMTGGTSLAGMFAKGVSGGWGS